MKARPQVRNRLEEREVTRGEWATDVEASRIVHIDLYASCSDCDTHGTHLFRRPDEGNVCCPKSRVEICASLRQWPVEVLSQIWRDNYFGQRPEGFHSSPFTTIVQN